VTYSLDIRLNHKRTYAHADARTQTHWHPCKILQSRAETCNGKQKLQAANERVGELSKLVALLQSQNETAATKSPLGVLMGVSDRPSGVYVREKCMHVPLFP
jgi:hypothetical protein